jgi:Terminase large subunit, T4likevirus-type, N-terminal
MTDWKYPYEPSAKQQEAHAVQVDELLYGGAAGGGKSEFLLAEAVTLLTLVPNSKVLLLRRTFPELEQELEPRIQARIPKHVGKYNSSKHVMTFFNGSQLRLGYLEKDADVYRYIGAEYQMILFDELTTFNIAHYRFLKSRVRAAGQVLEDMKKYGLKPCMKSSSNPGGRGHFEVKRLFIDPAPPMTPIVDAETGQTRMFIPAKLQDNPALDDDYEDRLKSLPMHLRRALLDGDWMILDGVRFPTWRNEMHTIEPYSPEEFFSYPRCVAVDYGYANHFAAVWLAMLPDNRVIQYRELYQKELTATRQAELILASEMPGERGPTRPLPLVMDPSMWKRGDGEHAPSQDPDAPPLGSPAYHYMKVLGFRPKKAKNPRIAGAALLDEHLDIDAEGRAHYQCFNTCVETIRTVPALPRAKTNPEDVDTTAEDHLYDALRYGLGFLTGRFDTPIDNPRESALPSIPETMTGNLSQAGF